MQRKKLSIISVSEQSPKFCCLKYSLMACNAFGIMLGIFVVLFGVSYPEEDFPGGYSGKTTAGISGVFIFFTGIGYCGAHHQKAYFLILYSFIIILFLGCNIAVSVFSPEQTLFDPTTKQFYFIACFMLLVMGLAFFLAWQVKHESRTKHRNDNNNNQRTSNLNSNNNNETSSQLSSKINQQQMHHLYQQPNQSTHQSSLETHFCNDQISNLNNRSVSAMDMNTKLPAGHQMSILNQSLMQLNTNNNLNIKNFNTQSSNYMPTNNSINKPNLNSLTPGSYVQMSISP